MSDEKKIEEIKERMRQALPHFRLAVKQAREEVAGEDGSVDLGILCSWPDGTGKCFARFEADSLFDDIAIILGLPTESTEEEEIDASAAQLAGWLSANGVKAE